MENKFVCHSEKQERLIFSDFNETYAITGIQWAKTTSGAWWMKRHMFTHIDKSDNFIIAAPTYKIMQQSTLPAFLKIMDGFGTYRSGDAVFEMSGGGTVYMRTGTEPDSVVGITNVRAAWGDEAGKFSRYFWENITSRASFKQAPKLFTSTPYAMNWMYKDVLKPYKEGSLKNTLVIQAKSSDNPYFPIEEYERRRLSMDPRRFNAVYNGEFEKMHGLVYDTFDELENTCAPSTLPLGTKYYAGVDWGTTHPFVIVVHAVTPSGHRFQVSEFYKTGYGITDMVQVAQKLRQVWGIQIFWCDPSQPGYIQEFNRHELPAQPAINDIRLGIDRTYSLFKERTFRIFKAANPYTLEELETYHYEEPKDLGPNDKDREQMPVDQENHCIAEGVLIETIIGPKPIETISIGDLVLTRDGFRKVLMVHNNGINQVVNINGLHCTPNHKIFTYNRGFIEAKNLNRQDLLCRQKLSYSKVTGIGAILNQNILAFANTFQESAVRLLSRFICIEPFGKNIMVPSLIDTTSTMLMATPLITTYPISHLFQPQTICLVTRKNGIREIPKSLKNILVVFVEWLLNGINLWTATNGTKTILKSTVLSFLSQLNRLATSVGKFIQHTEDLIPDFVVEPAEPDMGDMFESQVYDLTVENAHEYFANGVLVHNCMDAMRYCVIMTSHSHEKKPPHVPGIEKRQETNAQRIVRLKKGKSKKTEAWS